MATAVEALESLMGNYYRATAMGQGNSAAILASFRVAVDADPAFEPLAQTTLTDLKKINRQKCVITATKVDFLTQALNQ